MNSKSIEEHFDHLKVLFNRLKSANLKLNPEKCEFCKSSIQVLGHIISKDEISMDPAKIEKIKEWKNPRNAKDIQQFLGLTGYYRKFIRDYAKLTAPLTNLIKKDVVWKWSDECESSFIKLKKALISYPILRQPDFLREFILYTDASGLALGGILAQMDANGEEYVCHYASRTLKRSELHYGITEKECLAVLLAIKTFRVYLYGKHFKLITDHSALKWLMSIKDPNGKLARWEILLQTFDFEIIHRAGKKHANVDALSRINNVKISEEKYDNDSKEKDLDPYEDEILLHYLKEGKFLPGSSKKQCKRAQNNAKHLVWSENILYYHSDPEDQLVLKKIPRKENRINLDKEEHVFGHFGFEKTYKELSEKYY